MKKVLLTAGLLSAGVSMLVAQSAPARRVTASANSLGLAT